MALQLFENEALATADFASLGNSSPLRGISFAYPRSLRKAFGSGDDLKMHLQGLVLPRLVGVRHTADAIPVAHRLIRELPRRSKIGL